jgi:Protein of unknown function (DUF551)
MIDRETAIATIKAMYMLWQDYGDGENITADEIIAALTPQWQDIATAPKDGTILAFVTETDGDSYCETADWNNGKWTAGGYKSTISHWMPLPEAPAQ